MYACTLHVSPVEARGGIWYLILQLELQTAASYHMGSGKETRPFRRTAKAVNC